MKEENIAEYWSGDYKRKATISTDKYHYIARLYVHTSKGGLVLKDTRLFNDKSLRYVEDLCENYVEKYGEFKDDE